jgi:hypothetical protein
MIRKWLAIGIILLFIGTYSIPAVAHSQDDNQPQGIIFNLMFVMNIWWGNETQTPISPGETREVNLTVNYVVTHGAYRWRLLLHLLDGSSFPIRLAIENKSDW